MSENAALIREAVGRLQFLSDLGENVQWAGLLEPRFAEPLMSLLRSIADEAESVDAINARAAARAKRTGGDGHTFVVQRDDVAHAVALAYALLGMEPR